VEPLESTCLELEKENIPCYAESCDIRNYTQVSSFIERVLNKYSHLDVLINNAGEDSGDIHI
jgi:NADP-dependent 3-hydroxy acid dehydrogenase YdfG